MEYPLHRYQPANLGKPVLCIGHGNGFPPAMYAPLATALGSAYDSICLPARPWWGTSSPNDFQGWHQLAEDLIKGIKTHHLAPIIGVGHSMSGVAMTIAAVERPELFRAVIMIDPVFLPPHWLFLGRILQNFGWQIHGTLVKGALKRRQEWVSVQDAYERFRGRSLFSRCSDELVKLYTEGITRPKPSGDGVELAYPREWEAAIFAKAPYGEWAYVPHLRVPTLILGGAESDTFVGAAIRAWQRRRPDVPIHLIPQTGHLLPFEAPQAVADQLQLFLAKLS